MTQHEGHDEYDEQVEPDAVAYDPASRLSLAGILEQLAPGITAAAHAAWDATYRRFATESTTAGQSDP